MKYEDKKWVTRMATRDNAAPFMVNDIPQLSLIPWRVIPLHLILLPLRLRPLETSRPLPLIYPRMPKSNQQHDPRLVRVVSNLVLERIVE